MRPLPAMLLIFCASSAHVDRAQANVPVVWDPDLLFPFFEAERPHGIGDFPRLLRARWSGSVVAVVDSQEHAVLDCSEALALQDTKPWTATPRVDRPILASWRVLCGGIERVARMKAARASNVALDVQAILPALLAIRIDSSDPSYSHLLDSLGRIRSVECTKPTSCAIRADPDDLTVYALAVGDLDGDGVQDLMLQVNVRPRGGTEHVSAGMVVTRRTPSAGLTLLEWWR